MGQLRGTGFDKAWVSRRAAVAGLGTLLVGTSFAGCTGSGGGEALEEYGPQRVQMTDDLVFDPDELPVGVGGTVIWENDSSVEHTVTAYDDEVPDDADYFASGGVGSEQAARDAYPDGGGIPAGESYEHTFETKGTYEYFCIPHEGAGMKGVIQVSEEGPHL